jgi:hypothetical protein
MSLVQLQNKVMNAKNTAGEKNLKKLSSVAWLKMGLKINTKDKLVMTRKMAQQGWLNNMLVDACWCRS